MIELSGLAQRGPVTGIIKTYVRKGMGIGIVSCMAYDKQADHDLVAIIVFKLLLELLSCRKDQD